jgi:hypothetical protein
MIYWKLYALFYKTTAYSEVSEDNVAQVMYATDPLTEVMYTKTWPAMTFMFVRARKPQQTEVEIETHGTKTRQYLSIVFLRVLWKALPPFIEVNCKYCWFWFDPLPRTHLPHQVPQNFSTQARLSHHLHLLSTLSRQDRGLQGLSQCSHGTSLHICRE